MGFSPAEVTQLLLQMQERREGATPRLFELLYDELRRIAQRQFQNERPDHTLQATALINEAYFRLVAEKENWRNRAHFLAIASGAMRRILVDHARAPSRKRPSSNQRVDLETVALLNEEHLDEVIALDRALANLSQIDRRQTRIVELRYFGGLTAEEAAEALGVSTITVQKRLGRRQKRGSTENYQDARRSVKYGPGG